MSSFPPLAIPRYDARGNVCLPELEALREKLSPRGNVVSAEGKRRTLEVFGEELTPQEVVEKICRSVRERGRPAVLEYSAKIDGFESAPGDLRVPAQDLAAAHANVSPRFLSAVQQVRENILRFQRAILHRDTRVDLPHGGHLRQRYLPLRRVGVCVPGGAAAYPSTVLMTAVPAQAAGVSELAVVAPPTKNGAYNPYLLATCHELGLTEVYRLGGAQAVAALAYGIEGLPRVDKIVGPGSLFVALAKKHVYGDVDIDSIAGPSEIVVIADESTRADYVAADMIAQAEHAPGVGILISWRDETLDGVLVELRRQLAQTPRGDLARDGLERFGALVRVKDAAEAALLADRIAPEHLHIATRDAESLAAMIPSAGAIFLGSDSPVALGDYAAGPSHVLPTGGTARFASGLCANDFLRRSSMIGFTRQELAEVAPAIRELSEAEGLLAHRESVDIRLRGGDAPQGA